MEKGVSIFGRKVDLLEKNTSLMSDTLTSMKGQKDSEYMVVEMCMCCLKWFWWDKQMFWDQTWNTTTSRTCKPMKGYC
eukprot:4681052-Ditylum_brightwellii.AAC.1